MEINSELKMTALDMADDILAVIAKSDFRGITMAEGAEALGMPHTEFYGAAWRLHEMGKIKIIRDRRAGNRYRLVWPDAPPVDEATLFTPTQRKVLDYLCARADGEGLVRASLKQISEGIGHNSTCNASVDALDQRGFLEILDRGSHGRSRLYKVFPNGDGPKGWSAIWFKGPHRQQPWLQQFRQATKETDNADAS